MVLIISVGQRPTAITNFLIVILNLKIKKNEFINSNNMVLVIWGCRWPTESSKLLILIIIINLNKK